MAAASVSVLKLNFVSGRLSSLPAYDRAQGAIWSIHISILAFCQTPGGGTAVTVRGAGTIPVTGSTTEVRAWGTVQPRAGSAMGEDSTIPVFRVTPVSTPFRASGVFMTTAHLFQPAGNIIHFLGRRLYSCLQPEQLGLPAFDFVGANSTEKIPVIQYNSSYLRSE